MMAVNGKLSGKRKGTLQIAGIGGVANITEPMGDGTIFIQSGDSAWALGPG